MTALRNCPGHTGLTSIDHEPRYTLWHATGAHRAFILGEVLGAALVAAAAFVSRTHRRSSERRRARAARAVLARLDNHTLRDLGLHRSELFCSDLFVVRNIPAENR